MLAPELARDSLDFRARMRLGGHECVGAQHAAREEALRNADAAELERLEALRGQAAADDEFGRAATDVDDQARRLRRRQHVADAKIDEARLLMTRDDVDRKAERGLRLRKECRGILRDPECVGGHGAHGGRMQAGQAFPETREARQRGALGCGRQAAIFVHARAEANRFAPGVETEDLVAFDASHLEPEAVRSQVHDGERGGCRVSFAGGASCLRHGPESGGVKGTEA